jgi:eukaryotic-like serine/threonine-protein kinase
MAMDPGDRPDASSNTRFVQSPRGYSHNTSLGLPPELLAKARGRLRRFAFLMTCIGLAGMTIHVAVLWVMPTPSQGVFIYVFQGVSTLLSGLLYLVARSDRFAHTTVLHLGLGYEVLACLLISVGVPYHILTSTGQFPHLTFASVLIVLYPLIVPSRPRVTLFISLLSAGMAPLGVGIVGLLLGTALPAQTYIGSFIFPLLCSIIAYFSSRVVHNMNIEVARAQRMGSYILEERLGAGGMGEVWKARHRMLARPAAVKLIKPDALGSLTEIEIEHTLRRFENEAKATAQQRSAHTVDVYDFGVADDGRFYYVMELLEGLTLQELVEEYGPQSAERVVHILRQACHSLDEAHASGLVHRDIKPANMVLCRYGREVDFVKVLDFGLVKQSAASEGDAQLTKDGMTVGTPTFMAPEMAMGEAPDGRVDIYGLGCVAYWLLTGQLVFDAKTPVEAVIKHAKDTPVPPSARTEIDVPEALETAVLACLEKSPDDRPQSVMELDQLLATLALDSPWDKNRRTKWWDLHLPLSPRQ